MNSRFGCITSIWNSAQLVFIFGITIFSFTPPILCEVGYISNKNICLEKCIHREIKHKNRNAHSKNFVRPQLIYYFAVHQVTKSVNEAPVFYADVNTHARLQHYRADLISPEELSKHVVDTHIFTFIDQINNSLSSVIPNWIQFLKNYFHNISFVTEYFDRWLFSYLN